jgi:Protein of unknown function (DUF3467)
VDDEAPERQLNIHLDQSLMAGVYANFANVSFSEYEFTLTFARIDHEVEDGDVPGVAVARVNCSMKFMKELMDAMQDAYSKWEYRQGVRDLPEAPEH